MTGPPPSGEQPADTAGERRRRREHLFGDVLPDRTTDESDPGDAGEATRSREDWLRGQVPPHHG